MVVRMGKAAMDWARSQKRKSPSGMCQQFTRMAFNVGSGFPSASAAWNGSKKRHPTNNPMDVPPGVPVYFLGGSKGYGHAAVSLGNGLVRSTDWPSRYNVGTARISDIQRSWGQQFVGWTEDINGVTVWKKPEPKAPKTPNITTALRTKDPEKRRQALRAISRSGSNDRVKDAAEKYLKALGDRETINGRIKELRERRDGAKKRIKEARSVLNNNEVK